LEALIELDKNLFIFLNSLGLEMFDSIWLFITDKKSSIPLYLFLLYYIFKKNETKIFLKYIIIITLLVLFTDQISVFFKNYFQRLRPCHDLDLDIRLVKEGCGGLYGFFSSHATNSFGIATFIYISLYKYSKYFKYVFLWALIVSYSRIYVGVHFPMDIVIGIIIGIFSGYLFSLIFNKIRI
tara:strand:+ start:1650 stop:2195 length:546 start_codon:yes stop_codon:yes gene_type:complete